MFITKIYSQNFSSSLVPVNADANSSLIDGGIIITAKYLSPKKKKENKNSNICSKVQKK